MINRHPNSLLKLVKKITTLLMYIILNTVQNTGMYIVLYISFTLIFVYSKMYCTVNSRVYSTDYIRVLITMKRTV